MRRSSIRVVVPCFGLILALSCSNHPEAPAETPESAPAEDENRDGFNHEELQQLDELLDGGVSGPAPEEPGPAPASSAARPKENLRPEP